MGEIEIEIKKPLRSKLKRKAEICTYSISHFVLKSFFNEFLLAYWVFNLSIFCKAQPL